jgi:hypothetical protein
MTRREQLEALIRRAYYAATTQNELKLVRLLSQALLGPHNPHAEQPHRSPYNHQIPKQCLTSQTTADQRHGLAQQAQRRTAEHTVR